MDYHVITQGKIELIAQVVDGQLVIVPPVAQQQPEFSANDLPNAIPAP
jgi:hypothetical protein